MADSMKCNSYNHNLSVSTTGSRGQSGWQEEDCQQKASDSVARLIMSMMIQDQSPTFVSVQTLGVSCNRREQPQAEAEAGKE
ncbi:hypothetical protein Z517_08767 [Fonsecaea pedrosoi CBS 271.37]|uniref:Unplaced genomic scaffold supercont1.5, whole genome shotgun sequence n=1 Tax=Fonsecaea pedrosoi CBS 271.37 TaxID=1442368 RepID=A0A0D2GDT7_9EURO|nr:uncharacterized protein Z517_08767 [Fonsecaea pedrosoi CBS 271.37]KIW78928.1 hypothetical protein Z517_08767 [Fonsecaea pedrosoi CBS 271.37]